MLSKPPSQTETVTDWRAQQAWEGPWPLGAAGSQWDWDGEGQLFPSQRITSAVTAQEAADLHN